VASATRVKSVKSRVAGIGDDLTKTVGRGRDVLSIAGTGVSVAWEESIVGVVCIGIDGLMHPERNKTRIRETTMIRILFIQLLMNRLTVCVSCGGWEGGLAVETEKLKARKLPKNAVRTHRQLHAVLARKCAPAGFHKELFLIM